MKNKIIRCRKHTCGSNYKEVDFYPIFTNPNLAEKNYNQMREKQESSLAQKNLNEKNAKRKLLQLTSTNFTEKGMHISLTYKNKFLPKTIDDALKDRTNYLRNVRRLCKKQNLPMPKYIGVTEWQDADPLTKTKAVKFHHHIIIECELGRDELEELWSKGKGDKKERIGLTNADRLQFEHGCIQGLCEYVTKYSKHRRRWTQSLNLKQPKHSAPNDGAITTGTIERICTNGAVYDKQYWERKNPGWIVSEIKPVYNDWVGWSLYLKLYKPKKTKGKRNERKIL